MGAGAAAGDPVAGTGRSGAGVRATENEILVKDSFRAENPRRRAETSYVDGVRGCAALYVVINHLVDYYVVRARDLSLKSSWLDWAYFLTFGRFSVAIFIVLSGYVIAKPIVESHTLELPGGIRAYVLRRAKRIIPPYYAALLLSLAAIEMIPVLQSTLTPMWNGALPLDRNIVLSHFLLVHNLQDEWIYKINPPLWSVATEFQIYFFLPLALLPMWRRLDFRLATLFGIALGIAPSLIFGDKTLLASPWFLSLFAMGMFAARINFAPDAIFERWRRLAWTKIALALTTVLVLLCTTEWRIEKPWMISELLVGAWSSAMLIACTHSRLTNTGRLLRLVRFLESPPMLGLGAFSYSLYLIHQPVLSIVAGSLHFASLRTQLVACLGIGVPTCLVVAYGFHMMFERPFISRKSSAVSHGHRRSPP